MKTRGMEDDEDETLEFDDGKGSSGSEEFEFWNADDEGGDDVILLADTYEINDIEQVKFEKDIN